MANNLKFVQIINNLAAVFSKKSFLYPDSSNWIFFEPYLPDVPFLSYDVDRILKDVSKIDAIDFYESWSFDQNGNIDKDVLAIKLFTGLFDTKKNFLGYLPLFIICPDKSNQLKLKDLAFY